jgi:hypothetical protein
MNVNKLKHSLNLPWHKKTPRAHRPKRSSGCLFFLLHFRVALSPFYIMYCRTYTLAMTAGTGVSSAEFYENKLKYSLALQK